MQTINDRQILIPEFIESKLVQIAVDTSAFCNARCESCIWAYMGTDSHIMGLDEFRTLLNRFEGFQFSEFAFNVINEPFVDKTICEKIFELVERQTQVASLFFSSNWLLPGSDTLANFIDVIERCDACPTIQSISLNATISGIDEESYDRGEAGSNLKGTIAIYKKLDFKKAVTNICLVLRKLSLLRLRKPLRFSIRAYSDEFDQIAMTKFWEETLLAAGIPGKFVRNHVRIVLNHCRITFARYNQRAERHGKDLLRSCTSQFLTENLVINSQGELGLCCQDGIRSVVIGNLLQEPLMDVVRSEVFQKHLKIATGFQRPEGNHPCLHCEFYVPQSNVG